MPHKHRPAGSKGCALGRSRAEPWSCFPSPGSSGPETDMRSWRRGASACADGSAAESAPVRKNVLAVAAAMERLSAAIHAPAGHRSSGPADLPAPTRAFERSSQPGFVRLAPVQRRRRTVAAQASHYRSGGRFGLHAVGTPIPGHDVSGTGWQTLGRAMQSITTMMPVWQCGHSRSDCPVSASKRSR